MTLTPEAHLLYEAREIVPRCTKCDGPAEWEVWKHGKKHETMLHYCAHHAPACTEERGGFCKEGHELSGLAAALMRFEAAPSGGVER